ncbi:glycosyltransferase family 2 protein [Chroococcidiopsis sp. CCALA 051]|uniref:glycosyltransferase family 2 protein n=1 Tax=Chroococcidiopsis sp. CCALA 051 TaxID=869949 RepID=UPI000D0DF8B6|nr:glycosyltransferase [Chroococcidiopsis sp. CCALA 051]MBE9015424.1 glycosyltransferase [Chroococcidiopsidales cyanobacterium LEGE 13417]PSM50240.1 glycosyltransferase family 2 protein [Chroococcidiopsis sp. CCALA 051]
MPKVSVIIPNYNHAQFLEQRIQSVLDQTYQDFEIIYLDDASTDNSNEVFAKFANNSRIRAIYNQTNSGSPFKQWNKGIRLAQGEYVWIAESDDYADKRLLAELVDKLDNNPTVGLAYCLSWFIDERDRSIFNSKDLLYFPDKERWEKDFVNNGIDECSKYLIFENIIHNASAVLIRRSIYEKVGYADESLRLCGDWLLWVKMLLVSDIAFIAETLNYYRAHSETVRYEASRNGVFAEESYQIVRYILANIDCPKEVVEQVCETRIHRWLKIMFSKNEKTSWERQYKIYKVASTVDSKLNFRLTKKIIKKLLVNV